MYSISGNCLISGSEDGVVRVWDAKSHNIIRVFKHAKGNLNAMLIIAFLLALGFFFFWVKLALALPCFILHVLL